MKFNQFAAVSMLALLLVSCATPEPELSDVLDSYVSSSNAHQSVSYKIDYKMKYFNNPTDTNKLIANVTMVRLEEDTLFGGMIWLEGDSLIRYYDSRNIYVVDQKREIITEYPQGLRWPINGNWTSAVKDVYFFNPEKLLELRDDTSYTTTLSTEMLDGSDTWLLNVGIPADDYLSGGWKKIWIGKEPSVVYQTQSSYDMQGENQYRQRLLSDVSFDGADSSSLAKKFLVWKDQYAMEVYKPSEREKVEPLADGEMFPNLKGWSPNLEDTLDLKDVEAKLVIIDFWYMDCFPCIKAIPHLNAISEKYAEGDLAVIGVNPYNDNEKDVARFPNFLDHNPIDYPYVFISPESAKECHVRAYPTFYLLNEERKVVYSSIGYSEEMSEKIDSAIVKNLDNLKGCLRSFPK